MLYYYNKYIYFTFIVKIYFHYTLLSSLEGRTVFETVVLMWHNHTKTMTSEVQKLHTEVSAKDWNTKQAFVASTNVSVQFRNVHTTIATRYFKSITSGDIINHKLKESCNTCTQSTQT